MALNCYRCNPPKEPCVLVIDRAPAYPLCEKCGNSTVDFVEVIPLEQWAEQVKAAHEGAIEEVKEELADLNEAVEALDEGADPAKGEIVEQLEKSPPK